MALTIFQETIPFSNERLDQPVSGNGAYTNPIVMPLSFDITQYNNTIETVFYIKNTDTINYYTNIALVLVKKDKNVDHIQRSIGIQNDNLAAKKLKFFPPASIIPDYEIDFSYSSDVIPTIQGINLSGFNDETAVTNANTDVNVKFSYGYDELSNIDWAKKTPALLIERIGNATTPDTSYIPIRLRIEILMESLPLYTLRDYSIGIYYEQHQVNI